MHITVLIISARNISGCLCLLLFSSNATEYLSPVLDSLLQIKISSNKGIYVQGRRSKIRTGKAILNAFRKFHCFMTRN